MAKRPDLISPAATAWLVINGRADRECVVMDASSSGAKVLVREGSGIPDRFELAFFQEASRRRRCEVIWRRVRVLGIKFLT
jgi:hypothetical protein